MTDEFVVQGNNSDGLVAGLPRFDYRKTQGFFSQPPASANSGLNFSFYLMGTSGYLSVDKTTGT